MTQSFPVVQEKSILRKKLYTSTLVYYQSKIWKILLPDKKNAHEYTFRQVALFSSYPQKMENRKKYEIQNMFKLYVFS